MKRLWRSFRARLILGSVVWIVGGVGVSGIALSELFREHVTEQFDGELHGHATELADLVRLGPDGKPVLSRRLSDPRFLPVGSGYYWQIESSSGAAAHSPSLGAERLVFHGRPQIQARSVTTFISGPTGHLRLIETAVQVAGEAAPLRIGIGTDERLLQEVLAKFNRTLAVSLGVIALGLVVAAFLQVWLGLRPLGRVREALRDVRRGAVGRFPDNAPSEVQPLLDDLNALLVANQDMIVRARSQAGNLAHGLKTPLAILIDEGDRLRARGDLDGSETVLTQCDRMRRQIDYQIARARASASRSAPGIFTDVEPALKAIMSAMRRLHERRGVDFELVIEPGLMAGVDAQDFGEMVANLVDNAGKWATRVVTVSAARTPDHIRLVVDDDGPGLPAEAYQVVFDVGRRFDEHAPGSGLGLAIVRDLALLYDGRVWLEVSPAGGLRAILDLPGSPA